MAVNRFKRNQVLECVKSQDSVYELVQLRSHCTKQYHASVHRGDTDGQYFYSALYHAAQAEIIQRNKTGRV